MKNNENKIELEYGINWPKIEIKETKQNEYIITVNEKEYGKKRYKSLLTIKKAIREKPLDQIIETEKIQEFETGPQWDHLKIKYELWRQKAKLMEERSTELGELFKKMTKKLTKN